MRFMHEDMIAMKNLTEVFGHEFWRYAIFVLTFANIERVDIRDDRDADKPSEEPDPTNKKAWEALEKERFEGRIRIWKEELRRFLIKEIKVKSMIARDIPVVPAGDLRITRRNRTPLCLPDRDDWLQVLWETCCLRVKPEHAALFETMKRYLMKDDDDDQPREVENPEKVPVLVMPPANEEKNDSKFQEQRAMQAEPPGVNEPKKVYPDIWAPDGHKELRLLVTGKTGVGKSTLVNGILGKHVAKEGARTKECTTEVTQYQAELHGVPVTVFDSPGLQDITGKEDEYMEDMKKKCQNLSLVLYCTKMTNNCLKDEDKYAILKLTAEFGQRFWEFAVLVLTFANYEDVERRDDRDEDEGPEPPFDDAAAWKELEKKRFEGRLKKWKDDFHKLLMEQVGVTRDIVERIPVVPAGDHRESKGNRTPLRLPDRENWFDEFWKASSLRMRGKSDPVKDLEHKIEIQALERQAEEYKRKIDRLEKKKIAEESTQLVLLDKKPEKSDLLWLFNSSAAHYMTIGTALAVRVHDLLPTPGTATTNLTIVFERWIDSNKDMTWRKIVQVCENYPNELGRVKAEVEGFLSSDRARNNYL